MRIKRGHVETAATFAIVAGVVAYVCYSMALDAQESRRANEAFKSSCTSNGGVIAWGKCMRKDLFIELDKK